MGVERGRMGVRFKEMRVDRYYDLCFMFYEVL